MKIEPKLLATKKTNKKIWTHILTWKNSSKGDKIMGKENFIKMIKNRVRVQYGEKLKQALKSRKIQSSLVKTQNSFKLFFVVLFN